jgi:hypothetical protein
VGDLVAAAVRRQRAGRVWAGDGRATAWGAAGCVGAAGRQRPSAWGVLGQQRAGGVLPGGRAAAFSGRRRRRVRESSAAGEGAGEGERGGDR